MFYTFNLRIQKAPIIFLIIRGTGLRLLVIAPPICHCKEYPQVSMSLRGVPQARRSNPTLSRHCEEGRKSFRSNLIAWFPHAQLYPYVRHCEEGRKSFRSNLSFSVLLEVPPNCITTTRDCFGPFRPSQ